MKRVAIMILALALAAMSGAHAQTKKPAALPDLPCQPLDLRPECQKGGAAASDGNALLAAFAKPFQDLANFIGEDSDQAIALATAIPALQDGHGQQCWMATKQFGDVVKAHPVPVTLKAQTDLEALRLLSMAANNLCANPHCTQVFADLANGVQQLAPTNMSIPIPSLHDICSKVPQIAVVAPGNAPPPVAGAAAPTPVKP